MIIHLNSFDKTAVFKSRELLILNCRKTDEKIEVSYASHELPSVGLHKFQSP